MSDVASCILKPSGCASCARINDTKSLATRNSRAAAIEKKPRASPNLVSNKRFRLRRSIFLRVSPKQVTIQPDTWGFSHSLDPLYILQGLQNRRQPTMDRQQLAIDGCAQRQAIKAIHESIVNRNIILVLTLITEIKIRGHLSTLMVSSKHPDLIRIAQLQRKYQQQDLNRERTPVHIIPQKQILCLSRSPTNLQQLQQIVVLTMYVTCYSNGILQMK
mmetsp:Transcript_44960/g.102568  ORF Transcript_44960/g.102568 Transcript_44960/m.102568 type:complete len:218 (-) Transcript_44960:284-937(-)